MRIANVVVMLGTLTGLTGAFFGCGTSRPDAADGTGSVLGGESCNTAGATRECHYIVSEENSVRTCAVGVQTCTAMGKWGACTGTGGAPAMLESISLNPTTNGGLHLLSVNPATDAGPACSNPCDPACTGYNENCPDANLDAAIATTFPATTLPTCGLLSTSSCDCNGILPACGMACTGGPGCQSVARTGHLATYACTGVGGLCDFKCEQGATCNVVCTNAATCSTTCLPGSTCNVSCTNVGSCPINCAPGATCNNLLCVNSNCSTPTLGVTENACYQTPPVDLGNLGFAPGANDGFVKKVAIDPCSPGNQPDCELAYNTDGTVNTGRLAYACGADSYCTPKALAGAAQPPGGCCSSFGKGITHATAPNDGVTCDGNLPDLTMPGACKLPGGELTIVLCNRGPVAANGPIYLGRANASNVPLSGATVAAGTCLDVGTGTTNHPCRYDGQIDAGKCIAIRQNSPVGNGCGGTAINGNEVWIVNGPNAPTIQPECTLNPKDSFSTAPDQPGCANNLAVFGPAGQLDFCQGIFAPTQITQTYTGTCGPGQRPKWTTLGWNGLTPAGTKIEFFATLQGNTYDGGTGTPVGPQLIGRALSTPNAATYAEAGQVCAVNPPTASPVCPKNLANTIGAIAPTGAGPEVLFYETLILNIYLYPNATGTVGPTLNNWYISYTCVDYE